MLLEKVLLSTCTDVPVIIFPSAMKIHVSMETKILLDSVGGYFLEPRGLLVIEV